MAARIFSVVSLPSRRLRLRSHNPLVPFIVLVPLLPWMQAALILPAKAQQLSGVVLAQPSPESGKKTTTPVAVPGITVHASTYYHVPFSPPTLHFGEIDPNTTSYKEDLTQTLTDRAGAFTIKFPNTNRFGQGWEPSGKKATKPVGVALFLDGKEAGYAIVHASIKKSPEARSALGKITLRPWCSVSGKAMLNAKPAAGLVVVADQTIESKDKNGGEAIRLYHETKTDADGNYQFPQLAAIEVAISCYADGGLIQGGKIDLAPAEETGVAVQLNMGDRGVALSGKLDLPAEAIARIDWNRSVVRLVGMRDADTSGQPAPYQPKREVSIYGQLKKDGTYRFTNVLAGRYHVVSQLNMGKYRSLNNALGTLEVVTEKQLPNLVLSREQSDKGGEMKGPVPYAAFPIIHANMSSSDMSDAEETEESCK